MKKALAFLVLGLMAVSGAMAQYFFFRPLRVECSYTQFGIGPEIEYAIPSGTMDIALFLSGDISLSQADYGSLAIGSRICPFTFEGKGFYFCPMADILVEGVQTNDSLAFDLGYRVILFDFLTGFAEAGGVMYHSNYTYTTSFGFNFCMGLGVAL